MNAATIGLFERGDEKRAFDFLENIWLNNPITSLWGNWKFGPLEGLWRPSFLDNQKFVKALYETFEDKEFKRSVILQAVDMNTGEIVIFDETID
jgi:hypothetical protein